MPKNAILYCFLVYLGFYTGVIDTTHFEGGTITYKILNTTGSVVTIVLTQTYIYDYTKITCTNSMIANQSPKLTFNSPYVENSQKVNCIQYCNQSGGYIAPSVVSYCTDYSTSLGITVGQRSDTINITNGSYFLVAYQSSSWRQLNLPPNSGSSNTAWSISCLINLKLRSDGSYNQAPVATIISPIYIPVGIQQNIFIPTIDGDNDQVRCRLANGTNECGGACPPASLPNRTILFSNCTLLITGAKVNDWYAIAIQIEDFINSTSTTPLSSVPVQFLINVQAVSSCTKRPLLTGPLSQIGGCVGIQVGQSYVIELIAENFCSNSTNITDIATISFPIVTKTPIIRNTTTLWSVTLTWTPTASAVGSQILCAVAIDSTEVQSNQYCISFTVAQGSVPTCPGQGAATTQVTTYQTSMTSQLTSTQVTSLPSSITTVFSTIQSTLHGSTTGLTSIPITTNSVSTSFSSQTSSILSSEITTTNANPTSQSTYHNTTYTSLISASQSIISSTTTQSASTSLFSERSSTLSPSISTIDTNPSSESTISSTTTHSASTSLFSETSSTLLSSISTIDTNPSSESTISSTTTESASASLLSESSSTLSSSISTTDTNPSSESTISSTTTESASASLFSESSSTLSPLISATDTNPSSESTISSTTTESASASLLPESSSTLLSSISATDTNPSSESTISSTITQSASAYIILESSSTLSSLIDTTDTNPTSQSNFQYTTDVSIFSTIQTVTSMLSDFQSSQDIQSSEYSTVPATSGSFDTSTNTVELDTSDVTSVMILQQSSDTYQSTDTTKSIVTSSSSNSSSFPPWLAALLVVLALILIGLCICCCLHCCSNLCLCLPCKRRKKRPSSDEVPQEDSSASPSLNPPIIYKFFENSLNLDDSISVSTRPTSAISSRSADDIHLTGLTTPRTQKPTPHYALPLQRSPRVSPAPLSPDEYVYGSRQASKLNLR